MTHSLKKLEQNKYELTVELNHEELSSYVKKTEDKIAGQVQLDGFRKGKAPKEKIKEQVGEQYILEQALDMAVQQSLAKTLEEQKLEVINVGGLNVKENSASKLVYTVVLTMFPDLKLPDVSSIKVEQKNIIIDKKEIDDALDFLRTSRAKFIAKDGAVEIGNRVEVDFEVTSDGLPIEGGVSKSHPLIVGDNKFMPGFEEELIGMKAGEEKKFSLNAPGDYFHKTVAGKKLDFSVKVVVVQNIEKPDLNDDFAKILGKFSNLKELEENLRGGIFEEKKVKEKQRLRLEVLAKIFAKSKIELPKDMVNEKLNGMIAGFDNELHAKGMELSLYLAHLNKTEDELRKEWRLEAEKQVAYALILRKIAKDKNLYPSNEEVEQGVNSLAQALVLRDQIKPETIDLEKLKDAVIGDIVNEKVFEFLEKNCIA